MRIRNLSGSVIRAHPLGMDSTSTGSDFHAVAPQKLGLVTPLSRIGCLSRCHFSCRANIQHGYLPYIVCISLHEYLRRR